MLFMLFMGHLVIGLIAGFILYEVLHDRNVIIFCALGSVLPDILDKALGYIVFNSVLDNGRIYFHSLVIFLLFFIAGIIVWKYYRSNSFLCVASGILLHQLVDVMWMKPVTWYYPLLGPYPVGKETDYLLSALLTELSSPTEWIFFIAILLVAGMAAIQVYRKQPVIHLEESRISRGQRQLVASLTTIALFVLVLSIIIIYIWQPYLATML